MMRKTLVLLASLMVVSFALDYTILLDGVAQSDHLDVALGHHTASLTVEAVNTTLINYSVQITPRNLGRIAEKLGMPLADTVNAELPNEPVTEEFSFDVPEDICGTFNILGDVYLEEEGQLSLMEVQKQVSIPCTTGRARLISWAVSHLPWPLVNWLMGAAMGS